MVTETVVEIKVGSQTIALLSVEHQMANAGAPSDSKPEPTTGFTVISTPIELNGSKYWIEYRVVEAAP